MLTTLSIVYLFAGGVGAGALCIACCVDLFMLKEPFGTSGFLGRSADAALEGSDPYRRVAARVFLISWGVLAFGVACLVVDLGRLDRLEHLLLYPSTNPLSVGALALAGLLLVSAVPVAARMFQLRYVGRRFVVAFQVAVLPLALVVMAYTGVLLQQSVGVALWATWLTPVLFVLSSLSGGCGLVCLITALGESQDPVLPSFVMVLKVDLLLILLETIVMIAVVWRVFALSNSSASVTQTLLTDPSSIVFQLWWIGFVFLGMVCPAILEMTGLHKARSRVLSTQAFHVARGIPVSTTNAQVDLRKIIALCGVATLIGALCFRFAVVGAGVQRELELMDAPSAQVASGFVVSGGAVIPQADASSVSLISMARQALPQVIDVCL